MKYAIAQLLVWKRKHGASRVQKRICGIHLCVLFPHTLRIKMHEILHQINFVGHHKLMSKHISFITCHDIVMKQFKKAQMSFLLLLHDEFVYSNFMQKFSKLIKKKYR